MAAWILAIVAALSFLGAVIALLYKAFRNGQMAAAFAEDVAENHLTHVYHALTLIAKQLGVELGEPPPIRYLPFKK